MSTMELSGVVGGLSRVPLGKPSCNSELTGWTPGREVTQQLGHKTKAPVRANPTTPDFTSAPPRERARRRKR